MPKATPSRPSLLIIPPSEVPPSEKQRRLRDRQRWLAQVDLLEAFNRLFDFMPEYRVFLKRRPGEIMFLSNAMLRTLHVADEATLIGVTDHELTPGPLADLYQSRDETVLQTGQPLLGALEVWFTREGLPQWFTCYKLPLKNRQGETIGIIGFLREYNCPLELPLPSPLDAVVSFIHENLAKPLTVRQLADVAHLSPRQLQRLFRQILGMAPKAFINKMRVHQAAHLLMESELSLSRIALEVGFCDQSALTFYFKRELGITPLRFRQAAKTWRLNAINLRRANEKGTK